MSQDQINENIDIQDPIEQANQPSVQRQINQEDPMNFENDQIQNQDLQIKMNDQSSRMQIQEVPNLDGEFNQSEKIQYSNQLHKSSESLLMSLQSFQGKERDLQKMLPLLKSLKEYIYLLTNEICQSIFQKYEPDQKLNKLNYILEAHFEDIQMMINIPQRLLEQSDQENELQLQVNENSKIENETDQIQEQQNQIKKQIVEEDTLKANFYLQVLGNITNLMLNEVSVQKLSYMCEILTLFHTVISKYLARDPTCALLLDVSSSIFCWDKSLHQQVLPKLKSTEQKKNFGIHQFDQENSTHIKRIKQEQEWREKHLQVGMKLDVIKDIKINNMWVQGWTRGVITDLFYQNEDQEQFDQYNDQSKVDQEIEEISIKYEQDLEASWIKVNKNDWRIAPLNTFTQDYEWRYSLKQGDNIDCMDNEKDWYKSTVLKFRMQTNRDDEKVQEILVGFRNYHQEGSKTDDDGNKFFGWSDRYDSWVSTGDIRVQKYHSIHQQYIKVEQQNKQYGKTLDFDDRSDLISQNQKPAYYSAPRSSYFQKLEIISDALNMFGTQNGFEAIINNLKEASIGKIQLTLQTINSYCYFLSCTMPLWHRQFCCDYIDRFNEQLLQCLCYVNPEANDQNKSQVNLGPVQNDNFSAGLLEDMINKLVDPIWKRYNTLEMTSKIQSNYQVGIGAALLSLSKLEKRIQGLKYINQAISSVRYPYAIHKLVTTKELIENLRNLKIIDQIFGVRTHFELVHRSQDLIRLLFNEKEELLENEIDMIWDVCVKQGEQIKLEIYNNILEVIRPAYGNLSDKTKAFFIQKIDTIQPNQLIEKDIQLLNELSKKSGISFQKPEIFVIKAVNIMWSIAVLEKDYPIQLIKTARKNFQDLISSWEDSYKDPYIALCIDNISNNKMPLQNLKIASKLIESMNQSQYSAAGRKTRQEFASDLVEDQDFIGIIIQDLDKFIEYSNNLVKKGEITAENYSTVNVSQNHYFSYLKNIKSRLNRIMNILLFSKAKLKSSQIEMIWDILVVKSEMREKDQNEFFLWFKRLLQKDQRRLMSEELMIELFRKKIVQGDFKMLKSLKINGLDCIVRLFVLVNELQGNVLDLDKESSENNWNNQQYSGYANNQYNNNYRNNNNQDQSAQIAKTRFNRFRVNIMPQDLEGINVLWSMMETVDTSNYNLFFSVQRTLINIYSNLSSLLVDKRSQINDCFMIECMKCLESINKNNFIIRNDKEKRDSLTFICKTISTFLEGTEQYGIGNLKIQKQLEQSNYAQKLMFEIKLPIKRGIDASYIEINTYLNMSIWELKTLIAKNIDASPLCITIKRNDARKPEIKDFHNLKLLSELNISDNETFQVYRSKIPEIQNIPFIDNRGKMVPELANIIKTWFIEFSFEKSKEQIIEEIIQYQKVNQIDIQDDLKSQLVQKLAFLPDIVRVMTPKTCSYFIEKITTMQNISIDDYRVLNLFNNHCKTIGNGNLVIEEFMKFYEDQAKSNPQVVRSNLNSRGIQSDLKEKIDLMNVNWDNDKRIIKNEVILPRFKLSQDEQLFSKFLNLVELSQCDEQDGMWILLMNMQTNNSIMDKILNVSDLDDLLDLKNQNYDNHSFENQQNNFKFHKILYILQIVQSLINEYKKKNECFATVYLEENEINTIIYSNQENNQIKNQSPQNQQEESYWQTGEERHSKSEEKQKSNKMDADPTDAYNLNYPSLDDSDQIKENKNKQQKKNESNDDFERNPQNQSQNLDPQQAIALPYNGPLLPGAVPQGIAQSGYDIPIAPASQAALIGPPNQQNTINQQKSTLLNFKGIQIKQPINCSTAISQEDLESRKNWLPKFLLNGGMSKLICLLRNLSHIHRQVESSKKEQLRYVNEKIIKRCLKEVMECIKVLIVSQLSAQYNDQNISLSLQRKMSISIQQNEENPDKLNDHQNRDVEMIDESQDTNKDLEINKVGIDDNNNDQEKKINSENKKTKLQEEQQNTEEEMKPLIDLIQNNQNLRFDFKQQMDLDNFQSEILGLISEFIDKKDIKFEDIEIVNQGLSIWLSCLVSEPKLLNSVYQEFHYSLQYDQLIEQTIVQNSNSDENIFHFSKTLVEKGLVSSEYRMREAFQNTVKFIVSSIKSNHLTQSPLDFFVQLLISKFDYISQKHLAKQTRIFFAVLIEILNKYFEGRQQIMYQSQFLQNQIGIQIGGQLQNFNQQELIDSKQFLFETINRLLNYESTEKRNSLMEDYTLIGLFDVIRIFIENSVNSLTSQQFQELAFSLLDKCLFSINFNSINQHIVQSVDLQQYERQLINKCLTKESTQACFNLLLKICRYSQDKTLVFNILENYWKKIVNLVDKPPLPGFSPSTNGRSYYNYSGIKNLGAVCYMNSMNQQFFNIPTLRYCLLATQDKIPENIVVSDIVPYKGMQIDDNVLHQMMKMFGFLELTDRQCYDPTSLCFSIKNFGEPTNVREQKDAQEYLNIMFDQLEQQLKNTSQKYLIQNVFGGQFCYKKKCKNCGNVRSSNEDMLNISLEVKNQKSIYEALRKFVQGEIIQDFNCESCNKRVDLEKQTSISQLPNTLIIHLQRIIFDFDQLRNVKLNDRIEFPEILNMKEFMTSEIEKIEKLQKQQKNEVKNPEQIQNEEGKADDDQQIQEQKSVNFQESNLNQENELQKEDIQVASNDEEYEYRLVGVVDHMGSADAGHYLSFINVERDQDFNLHKKGQKISRDEFFATEKYTWLEFNDRIIQNFKVKDLETLCFGGLGNQNAYMLVYEKMLKRKMKIVIPKQIIDLIETDTLACDGTAITRDSSKFGIQSDIVLNTINNNEEITSSSNNLMNQSSSNTLLDLVHQNDFHLFYVFPNLIQQLKKQLESKENNGKQTLPQLENDNEISQLSETQNLYFDKIKNEFIALLNFEDVRKFVPNDIYKIVHEDNKKFLSEKQIFSDAFFNTTLQLVEIALAQLNLQSNEPNINNQLFELVFIIVERVMFDLLCNSQQIQALKGMCDTMVAMLQKSDAAVQYLVNKRIFIPQENLMKDERNFFETLATHVNQEVREMASSILLTVLNRLIQIGGNQNENSVLSAIQQILNQMDEECPKHWMRLDTYLNFIYELIKSNSIFLRILLQNKIVFKLINLMNKYNPSSMVYMNACPPLEKLVQTICTVVRFFPCLVDVYDLENTQFQEGIDKQTFLMIQQNERGSSAQYIDIQKYYSAEQFDIDQVNQWLILSDECLSALFMKQKSLKTFLQNVTKNGYSIQEFSYFIAHLCFKNKEYSLKIAKHILKGTNSSGADELQPFLQIMKEFLIINDEFTDLRIEWIFGVPCFITKQNTYQNYNQVLKIGVSFADHINTQVCKYFSPIYKTASTYYSRKDCALQALISNRRNQSKAVLLSLKTIFEAIFEDKSMKILKYLKCMDPPTYQFARYWDWIKPWIINEVEVNTRNQNIQAYRNELELSINVLSMIEEIEKNDRQIDQGPQNQAQSDSEMNMNTIIEYPENDNGPKAYLMWDIIGASIYDKKEDERNKISMWINQVTCSVSKSFPTGENNLALLDQFNSNQNNYQYGQGSGGTGFIKNQSIGKLKGSKQNHSINRRQAGRGRTGKTIQKQSRINQISDSVQPLRYKKKEINLKKDTIQNNNNEDADSEEGSGEDNEWGANYDDKNKKNQIQSVKTNQDQINIQKNVRFADTQIEIDDTNQDQLKNQNITNPENIQDQDIINASSTVKTINIELKKMDTQENGQENNQQASVSVSDSSENGDAINEKKLYQSPKQDLEIQDKQEANNQDDQDQIVEQIANQKEDVREDNDENEDQNIQSNYQNQDEDYNENIEQFKSNCLFIFKAENNSPYSQTVELTIRALKDQQGNPLPCNFKIPASSILCEIMSGSSSNILLITKLDPNIEDWGQFDWNIRVVVKNKLQQNIYGNKNNSGVSNNDNQWSSNWYDGQTNNDYGNNDNMIDAQTVGGNDSVRKCPICTYDNVPSNTLCEMCNSNLF